MNGVFDRVKGWLFEEDEEQEIVPVRDAESSAPRKRKPSILSLHNNARSGEEIFIRRPNNREDATFCADCLRARCPVVVNLNSLDEAEARRFFDFLAGVVYAIDGQMESVGEGIFLMTPRDMDIAAEFDGKSASNGSETAFWQEASLS